MKIYVTHSSSMDYEKFLYRPLLSSILGEMHELTFPHQKPGVFVNSKKIILGSDIILAEVSYPSIGQGIELGWADIFEKNVICFHQTGRKYSRSLDLMNFNIFEYRNTDDLIDKLVEIFNAKF